MSMTMFNVLDCIVFDVFDDLCLMCLMIVFDMLMHLMIVRCD